MIQNRHSSPIIPFISDEDMQSSTESDSSWWGPENQLGLEPGLEPGELFGSRRDDEEVALEKRGEIKYHEAIAKY